MMIVTERQRKLEPYVFPGAEDTLAALLAAGDNVVVWSLDYPRAFGESGLGKLRKKLPPSRRTDFSISFGADKFSILPHLLDRNNAERIVFVDDDAWKLQKAYEATKGMWEEFHFLHIQDTGKQDLHRFTTIPSVTHLPFIRETIVGRSDQVVIWLIDFNNTLVNRNSSRI